MNVLWFAAAAMYSGGHQAIRDRRAFMPPLRMNGGTSTRPPTSFSKSKSACASADLEITSPDVQGENASSMRTSIQLGPIRKRAVARAVRA